MTDHTTTLDDDTEDDAAVEPAAVVPQMDLGELLETAVAKAVTASLAARAKKIADGVVADMLTPEVLAGMRENARLEAELALNTAPSTDPGGTDDRGETQDPRAGGAEQEEPQKPELMYRTLDGFVENHIAHLFRRAVVGKGTERSLRWCPRWWEHGEAIGRLSALWRAFEEMRHGEGAEMASWWVQYADPMMAELLSTAGPFRECSVAKGHVETAKLPTVPAPAGMFEDGHTHDDDAVPVVSSLELPAPAHSARRMVMEFPG